MTTDLGGYATHLERAAQVLPARLREALASRMRDTASTARRLAAQRMTGISSSALASIRGEASADLVGRVYGDTARTPWLRIQEEGGTIRATRGPWLVIPQPDGSFRKVHAVTLRPQGFMADAFTQELPATRRHLAATLADEVAL